MYLEIFLADFAVFRVFGRISRDFAEMPEFRGSATARNIRSPVFVTLFKYVSRVTERNLLGNPHIVGSLNLLTCII